MSVHHMHAVFAEPRRERQIPAPRVIDSTICHVEPRFSQDPSLQHSPMFFSPFNKYLATPLFVHVLESQRMHYRAPLGCRIARQMALGGASLWQDGLRWPVEIRQALTCVLLCSEFLACVSLFYYSMRCKVRLADVSDVLDWSGADSRSSRSSLLLVV